MSDVHDALGEQISGDDKDWIESIEFPKSWLSRNGFKEWI